MKFLIVLLAFICCGFVFGFEKSQDLSEERCIDILRARAETPGPEQTVINQTARGGNVLFSMQGPDHAECVRSIPDVTGDGKDEVVVGFNVSQVRNLYCMDGSSIGTATVVWSLQTNDGVSGGGFYGDRCLARASDVDGNSYGNLLAGTAWGGRTAYCMDGYDGATVWKLDTYLQPNSGWVYSMKECEDVNGDDVPDVAIGTGSDCDRLFMIDGTSTGGNPTILWQYPSPDVVFDVDCIGDVNGDEVPDILGAIGDYGDALVCLSGANGSVIWPYQPGTTVYACCVLPDITDDGINEALAVLWTGDGSAVRCLNGTNGDLIWSSTDVSSYGMEANILEDVTGDGLAEVIVSSWDNAVIVLSGADGTLVWKVTVGGDVWTSHSIPDLNGDGREDVIAGSFDYNVYALDGDTGEIFWAFQTTEKIKSVYPVGDLNDDGWPEVAAGLQDLNKGAKKTLVYVLEGDADIPYPGLTLIGTGQLETELSVEITGDSGWAALIMYSLNTGMTWHPIYGWFELAPPFYRLPLMIIPTPGPLVAGTTIPNDPGWIGITLYIQGLAGIGPNDAAFTDMESVTFF